MKSLFKGHFNILKGSDNYVDGNGNRVFGQSNTIITDLDGFDFFWNLIE